MDKPPAQISMGKLSVVRERHPNWAKPVLLQPRTTNAMLCELEPLAESENASDLQYLSEIFENLEHVQNTHDLLNNDTAENLENVRRVHSLIDEQWDKTWENSW